MYYLLFYPAQKANSEMRYLLVFKQNGKEHLTLKLFFPILQWVE